MANFLTSSIGKKFIQSVSGAFLVIFLLLHGTINFFSVIDSLKGVFGKVAADDLLFSTGDGWFQLGCDFMSTPFIDIMVPILALGFLIHICYGIWLSYENVKKRGGLKRYEVASKAKTDSWSSRNMAVLGIIVLGFIAFHLTHFWAKMQLQEFTGGEAENPYYLLIATFRHWWVLALYIVWFIALWLHLNQEVAGPSPGHRHHRQHPDRPAVHRDRGQRLHRGQFPDRLPRVHAGHPCKFLKFFLQFPFLSLIFAFGMRSNMVNNFWWRPCSSKL